jgi:hypothetical protein
MRSGRGSGSSDIPYALYEPMRKGVIKSKARGDGDHLTPSNIHIPLCITVYVFACAILSLVLLCFNRLEAHSPKL